MQTSDFTLHPDSLAGSTTLRRWLYLAVATLAISGIAPLILLAGRASMFAEKTMIKTLFHEALVVHVDLSVLAWFLGIALLFWSLLTQGRPSPILYSRGAAQGCFLAGCLCIAFAPFMGNGTALMSNYIPVYTGPLFFLGLSLLFAALVLGLVSLLTLPADKDHPAPLRFAVYGSAYIIFLALVYFVWSWLRLDNTGTQDYYETLFWAGGHTLQLAYTQLLLLAWLWLASASSIRIALKPAPLAALFLLYPLFATAGAYAFLDGSIPYNLHFFTTQMRHGGGFPTGLLGLYILYTWLGSAKAATPAQRTLRIVLGTSFFVFATGGIIGFIIRDSNTIIPAHYHGSIVGTTLAFMGVIYALLPKLGLADVLDRKLTRAQPLLYGGGSVIHALGFAIAGSYGAARKTVGVMENVPEAATSAMKMARHGGSLAVVGGMLFVIMILISIKRAKTLRNAAS